MAAQEEEQTPQPGPSTQEAFQAQPSIPTPTSGDVPPPPVQSGLSQQPAQTEENIPVQAVSGGGGRRFPKIPVKPLLLALVGLVFLGLFVFLVRKFIVKPEVAREATLIYWGLWEDSPVVEQVLREYESQNEGVKISYIKQSKEDYRERLANSLARGSGPDIFRYHNTWVPMLEKDLATLPPEIMDTSSFQNTFYPAATQTLRAGINIVGIPLMYEGLGLYINEEILARSAKTAPKTWDELKTLALQLTVKDEKGRIEQAGVALGSASNVDHWQDIVSLMMLQNGASLANPADEFARDVLAYFTLFSTTDERVWDETLPLSTQAFAAGKLAMYFGPSWRAFEIKNQNPSLKFKVVPVPQLPKDTPGKQDITWTSFWAEGVWSGSQNKDEAWQFLNFMSSQQTLQKMYAEASKTRLFGEIYPRLDMAELLENDPLVGAYVAQAPAARSWYLTSRTFDGPTGINSRISAYYEDAINAVVKDRKKPEDVLGALSQGVGQVLASYGLSK